MGTVYEGENSRIGRRVAIKVLHAQVAAMPEFVERFEREARAAARIGSQHVCDVLDLGDLPSGDRYIVMEYLDGVSFEDRLLAKGKLSAAQLAPIAFELLEGLGTMHLARVIHRDLKPANVFLARLASGRGETVKILDFGVAKLQPFEGEVGTMTQTGTMMGTPLYMSPEQARGARDVDGRTDLYAASVMFYRALAGVLPYTADTLNELLFKIVLEEPKALRDIAPEVDEVFAAIVHKGLSRDLDQRFQTAREYQEAIAAWGKTQGRSSLSFSVTMPSEPPGPSSAPGDLPAIVAAKTPPNDGTPTAWSEDGPEAGRRESSKGQIAAVRPAAGESNPNVTVASGKSARAQVAAAISGAATPVAAIGDLAVSASASTVAMKSDPPNGPWAEGPAMTSGGGATGPAIPSSTKPSSAALDIASAQTPALPGPTRPSEKRISKTVMALGGLGAAGALAFTAFLALGRGHGPATDGLSPTTTSSANAAAVSPAVPSSTTAPTASSAESPATREATGAIDASVTAEPVPTARPTAVTGARRTDLKQPAPLASSAVAVAPPGPAVANTAAPPVASTAPKPASSAARKFRTNLD